MNKMATNYPSNEQRTNYARLCRAIIDLSADVLRELLKKQVSPSNIWTKVKKNPESNKVIKKDQWSIIYNAVSIGTYEKFDATLLILVLRLLSVQDVCSILETSIPYQTLQTTLQTCPALSSDPQTKLSQQELKDLQLIITKKSYIDGKDQLLWKLYTYLCAPTHKNLVHPTVKWGNAVMPDPAHTTVGDDVERLRHLRNKAFGHVSTTEITKQEFDTCWKELDEIMERMDQELLGYDFKESLDQIRTECMDAVMEKKLLEEISKMKKEVQEVKDASVSEERRIYENHTKLQIDRHEKDKTFVVTHAVSKGIDILLQHGILIYSGRPGQGKTKNALETMKQIREKYPDWKFIELDNVRKWTSLIDPNVSSVILLNDVIGKSNLDAGLINDGDKHFIDILVNVKEGKVKVIMTIRNVLLDKNTLKLEKYELFDSRYTIDLTAGQFKLNKDTKENILLRHCKNNEIEICKFNEENYESVDINDEKSLIRIDKWTIHQIVQTDPVLGFPFACHLFCCKRKYTRLGVKFFTKPNQYLIDEISSLVKSEATSLEKIQFCVMVYMLMKNGKMGKDLDIEIFNKITKSIELSKPPTNIERKDAIDKILDRFIVRDINFQYEFKHQTILESVAVCFTEIDPCLLLEVCNKDFIIEFVRPENFEETEGEVVCKVDKKAYSTIVDRFVYSIENGKLLYQYDWWINHPLLQNEEFVNCLVDKIQSKSNGNNKLFLAQVFEDVCFESTNTLILEKLYTLLKPTHLKKFYYSRNHNVLKWLVDHNLVHNYHICSAFHQEVSYVNHPCLTLTEVIANIKNPYTKCNSGVIKAIFNRWPCIERCHVLDLLKNFICKGRSLDCIKAIVDCWPNIVTDVKLKEMFSLACIGDENNLEIIEYLLSLDKGNKKSIHINNANDDKLTNLHLAACYGKLDVCKKLIKLGLRLDVRTVSGLSVLQVTILGLCCLLEGIEIIRSLIL